MATGSLFFGNQKENFQLKVRDLIECSDPKEIVLISGTNPERYDNLDEYFYGKFCDVPEHLKDCEVFKKGWSLVRECYFINIPYLK